MATVAKDVTLSLGLLTCQVSMLSALEPAVSNTNVCTGAGEHKEHSATKISVKSTCSVCGDMAYTDIKKARQVGDAFVLLDAEELAEAGADATRFKKAAGLTAHPAGEVDLNTVTGEKLYYLKPQTGSEPVYAVLFQLVQAHPELSFLTQWAPRTKAAMFALKAFNGVLCLQERTRQENVRQAPEVTTEAPEQMLALAEQVLAIPGLVQPFDAASYADTFEQKIAEIVATKTPISLIVPDAPDAAPAPTGGNAMDALQAMLAEGKPAAKRPRKTASA